MTLRAPRIPPLVVALVMLALQWVCAHFVPAARFVLPYSVGIATLLAAAGIAVALAGVLAFRRANTTVNPTRPQATSALVIRGVYQISRNPMYLGFLLVLAGTAIAHANALAITSLPLFVLLLNQFQIEPEEQALRGIFGEAYLRYQAQVRRWV